MSVQDSESRRFEQTFGWVFLIGPGTIFFGIFEKFETFFFEDLRSWRAVQKSFGGYL